MVAEHLYKALQREAPGMGKGVRGPLQVRGGGGGTARVLYGSLVDYIHLNPVRAGIVSGRRGESVLDYPWSSLAGGYALPAGRRAKWLAAGVGLERLGYRDTAAGRKKMVEELDRRSLSEGRKSGLVPLPAEVDARMSHLRRGWYWGRQEFAQRLRRIIGERNESAKSRAYLRAPQRVSHGLEEAERLVMGKGCPVAIRGKWRWRSW